MSNIQKAMISQNLMWFNPLTYAFASYDLMRKNISEINKTLYPVKEDTYERVEPKNKV